MYYGTNERIDSGLFSLLFEVLYFLVYKKIDLVIETKHENRTRSRRLK